MFAPKSGTRPLALTAPVTMGSGVAPLSFGTKTGPEAVGVLKNTVPGVTKSGRPSPLTSAK